MGKNVQLKILIWHMVGEKWLKVGQGKVESKLCQNKKKCEACKDGGIY